MASKRNYFLSILKKPTKVIVNCQFNHLKDYFYFSAGSLIYFKLHIRSKPFKSKIFCFTCQFSFDNISTQWTCTAEQTAIMCFHFQPVFLFIFIRRTARISYALGGPEFKRMRSLLWSQMSFFFFSVSIMQKKSMWFYRMHGQEHFSTSAYIQSWVFVSSLSEFKFDIFNSLVRYHHFHIKESHFV